MSEFLLDDCALFADDVTADSDRQPERKSRTARSSSSVNPDMNSSH
jgi:hypothetical protein